MKKQRIISLLLAFAMVFSLLPASAMAVKVETFNDVSKDDWYYKYVDFVADKEYFVGTSKNTFSPEMSMTRAMFVVVLAALEGVKVDNNVSPFADVPANTWYSGAVKWAAEKGVVAGIGDNKFAPDSAISREQMAVMMKAYVEWHTKNTGETHKLKSQIDSFKDADSISSWAAKSVESCRKWGLIAGMPDGKFYPQNTASRAEVATVIYNLAWLVFGGGGGGGVTPPSPPTPGHTHSLTATAAKAATCTEPGNIAYWYCAGCGKYFSDANGTNEIAANSWVIPALGHTEEIIPAVDPTCTTTGLTEGKKCSVCGETLVAQTVVPALGHTEVVIPAVPATCTTTGLTEGKKCSVCGEILIAQNIVPAKGHKDDDNNHFCDVCGEELCDKHNFVIIPAVAPTCTTTGLTAGEQCSICGQIKVAQTVVPALGHTEEIIPAVAPTCTATGLTEGKKCSVCGETLVAQNPVAALDHNYDAGTVTTAPTCTTAGVMTYVCQNDNSHTRSEAIPALGHDYQYSKTIAPDCLNGGYDLYVCANDAAHTEMRNLKTALGHTNGAWKWNETQHWHICSVCGQSCNDNADHNFDAGVLTEATQTSAAYTTYTCLDCGYQTQDLYIDYIYNAVSAAIADVKADIEDNTGHKLPVNGDKSWKDAYIGYTGLTLGANGDKRAIDVTVSADLGTDAVKAIVKFSVVNAIELAGGVAALVVDPANVAEIKAQVKALVNETIDMLEKKTGINITMSKESVEEIIDYVVEVTEKKVSDSVEYGKDYMHSIRKHFVGDKGGYVTGNVEIVMPTGHYVELDMTKNSASLGKVKTDKDVVDIAYYYAHAIISELDKIDTDALRAALKNGIIRAVDFAKVKIKSNADAVDFVNETIAKLENALNITVPMNSAEIAALAVEVYDYALAKAYAGYVYGEKIFAVADKHSKKITAAAYLAAGIAKQMYADLITYTYYTPLNKITLSAEVNIVFSGLYLDKDETAYFEHTEKYPYVYPVSFTMKMADNGSATTLGDNVQYKYNKANGLHTIKFVISEKAQAAYTALINKTMESVVNPVMDYVVEKLVAKMNFSGLYSSRSPFALMSARNTTDDEDISIEDILAAFPRPEIKLDSVISSVSGKWSSDNVLTGNIATSPMLDYLNNGDASVLDNSALYDAVDEVLDTTLAPMGELTEIIPNRMLEELVKDPERIEGYLADYAGDSYDQLEKMGLTDYAVAAFREELDPTGKFNGGKKYTESSVIVRNGEEVTISPKKEMQDAVDNAVADALESVVNSNGPASIPVDFSDITAALNAVARLSDPNFIADAPMSKLASALKSKTLHSFVDGRGDSITNKVCDLVELLPAKASISIGGVTIRESKLNAIRNATTTAAACDALGDVIGMFGNMSLSTFKDPQVITVKYGSKSASFGLEIDVK